MWGLWQRDGGTALRGDGEDPDETDSCRRDRGQEFRRGHCILQHVGKEAHSPFGEDGGGCHLSPDHEVLMDVLTSPAPLRGLQDAAEVGFPFDDKK